MVLRTRGSSCNGAGGACDWTIYVVCRRAPCLDRVGDFLDFLRPAVEIDPRWSAVLKAEGAGWPVGAKEWIAQMEVKHGQAFTPAKRGPKAKGEPGKTGETGDIFV